MGSDSSKYSAQWFFEQIFQPETIRKRNTAPAVSLPKPLRAARALETELTPGWQSREALFCKQGRLLAAYEDDAPYEGPVLHYYPTYQSLSDPELRGYFTWRTAVRRGDVADAPLTFGYLYIYELINQIGVPNPEKGFDLLTDFVRAFQVHQEAILVHMDKWLRDYVICYDLDPRLLATQEWYLRDEALAALAAPESRTPEEILQALNTLTDGKVSRSRFFRENRQDMTQVLYRVIVGMYRHCASTCKTTMVERYFGVYREIPLRLFDSAVFQDRQKVKNREVTLNGSRFCCCRQGKWSMYQYAGADCRSRPLEAILKAVDAAMRQRLAYRYPLKSEPPARWIAKLIDQEITAVLAEKASRITIDLSRLDRIRRDAAHTQEALAVEEELWEPEPNPAPAEEPAQDTPLDVWEYRLLRCLLYGGTLDWVRAEGKLLSVLADGINEKLYDQFGDSVLSEDGELFEDYIEELKEMVHP